jgi:putative PIN family toxin of toxin-antitoxin system
MRAIRVVLDTSVLFAGLYSSKGASFRVLRAIDRGKIRPVLSTTLLFEYEDALKRKQAMLGLADRDIEAVLDALCYRCEHQKIFFLWRPYLSDPKDDHILELAVASQTEIVVTFNAKDFVGAEKFGIRTATPRELLEEIR